MDLVKKHAEDQEKIASTWKKALDGAREKINKKNSDRRNEIKEQIKKLINDEKNILNQLMTFEKEKNADIVRQFTESQMNKGSESEDTLRKVDAQRHTLWAETLREIEAIIEKQKDKIKRLDEQKAGAAGQTTATPTDQFRSLFEMKTNNINEFHKNMEIVRKEIEKIVDQIEDCDLKEREKLVKLIQKTMVEEHEEQERAWKKFMIDIKK